MPEGANVEETVVADDKPCSKCGKYDKPEWVTRQFSCVLNSIYILCEYTLIYTKISSRFL